MSEEETRELIQRYKDRYWLNSDEELWQFIANCLARDLIESKKQVCYMKEKLKLMEKMNDTTRATR